MVPANPRYTLGAKTHFFAAARPVALQERRRAGFNDMLSPPSRSCCRTVRAKYRPAATLI